MKVNQDNKFIPRFFFPGWHNQAIIEEEHASSQNAGITITSKTLELDIKAITVYFLEHINDAFDDDLISDVGELISGTQPEMMDVE